MPVATPYLPNIIVSERPDIGSSVHRYPVYPSAKVTVSGKHYIEAIMLIEQTGAECVFCDGEYFLVPEYESGVIDLLVRRFSGTVEYGCAREAEYCTLAIRAGVSVPLIELGHAVQSCTGITPQEMVEMALKEPESAKANWDVAYISSMSAQ